MISHTTKRASLLLALLILLFPSLSSTAEIPESLKEWVPWVLHDQDQRLCTSAFDGKQKFCVWPTPLGLDLGATGGTFRQQWQMKAQGWIILPGNERHWPQDVLINNKPALVVNQNGSPAIFIDSPGEYTVNGSFTWQALPESIQIPAGTAIIEPFMVDGTERLADLAKDVLWLSRKSATGPEQEQDTVQTQVYRHIKDTIPMVITSHIDVQISGKPREILIDWKLPDGQIPLDLQCPLPVKIGVDGQIHMQARPGNYAIIYRSRSTGPVENLLFDNSPLGPDKEYWSFEAQNQLRMVKISGVPAIDPSQTTIPPAWHSFPAYQLEKGQSMVFDTLKRGNPEPAPNNLTLHRTFWLDSDGEGITVQDNLTGTVYRNPRLEMQEPAELGRMVINDRDQLITTLQDGDQQGPAGVEVRQGQINALAVSRVINTTTFPAGGWGQNIQKLSADLILQPGWKVFHATGVDSVNSWISRWTLLDCFIVLIIVTTTFKLLGPLKGLVALIALVLSYHDQQAPVFLWLAILCCIAILSAAPDLKFIKYIKAARILLLITTVIVLLPYSVKQLREGFYPQLEKVYNAYNPSSASLNKKGAIATDAVKENMVQSTMDYAGKAMRSAAPASISYTAQEPELQQYDTQSKLQAGPGVPDKVWRSVRLSWNGPVDAALQLQLYLISPLVNFILSLLKVAALFLLAFFMVNRKDFGAIKPGKSVKFELAESTPTLTKAVLLCLLISGAAATPGVCANYPSQELLDSLRTRLTEPARCFPNCADISTMQIRMEESNIQLQMTINASVESALPLPGGKGFVWQSFELGNAEKAQNTAMSEIPAFADNDQVWVPVPAGQHVLRMSGRVNRSDLQLGLPVKPHLVHFEGSGQWTVSGLDPNNVPGGPLQFVQQKVEADKNSFGSSTLPPLMEVRRILHLGLQWNVETIVTRLSPSGTSVYLKIPLLDGESVTNGEYKVTDNVIEVNFSPGEQQKRWNSVFKERSSIALMAPDTTEWTEVWRLNASPVWHIETEGIHPIHHHTGDGTWQPEWQPWAGEKISMVISRPKGVAGETKTIESSFLKINPGIRSTSMALTFTIRSTRGDQQNISLPGNAIIQSVKINDREQPIKKDSNVVIPLVPGSQKIEVNWNTPDGISTLFQVPKIDLGSNSVNSTIEVQIGNRWVWYVKGPQNGPAILFYSELLIILLAAIVLGLLKISPLNIFHWLLLGLGLSQSGLVPCLIIVVWFAALWYRAEKGSILSDSVFNGVQVLLVILTLITFGAIIFAVQHGLLGHPDMLIAGNGSGSYLLRWYQDRILTVLPQPVIVSIPIMAYRILMLLWALWLAFNLLKWTKWGWQCFTKEKGWVEYGFRWKKDSSDEQKKTPAPPKK
jgi:hypothetical protein